MRTVVVIQARMGSSRLPGKVLLPLGTLPVLGHVVERCRRSAADEVVVATSVDPKDDVLEAWCRRREYPLLRGAEDDVLSRYVAAARLHRADIVVRVTADCPAQDPATMDRVVRGLIEFGGDYAQVKAEERFPDAGKGPVGGVAFAPEKYKQTVDSITWPAAGESAVKMVPLLDKLAKESADRIVACRRASPAP